MNKRKPGDFIGTSLLYWGIVMLIIGLTVMGALFIIKTSVGVYI